jgi:pyruvate dehydrogenase E2 component (dihydrolipoamide acetyltransferase)
MASEIVMPRMGLTMEEGTLVNWSKEEGQEVTAGEPLFEIETDKSAVEIEATENGVLRKILVQAGTTVPVGTVIGILVKADEALPTGVSQAMTQKEDQPQTSILGLESPPKNLPVAIPTKVKASPAARQLAKKLGLDLRQATGSGPGGRIVAWNVHALSSKAPAHVTPLAAKAAAELGVDLSGLQGSGPGGRITRQDVEQAQKLFTTRPETLAMAQPAGSIRPFTRIEQVLAKRMVESFTSAPHFYLHVAVDARLLVGLREQLKAKLKARSGVHLTYTDLLVYFCARTLARHPEVMSQWTPKGMRLLTDVHMGVAVDTERGLLVPVIRNADRMGLSEISCCLMELTSRARAGTLLPAEQEEGVFTISNLGAFGIDAFDAVLNPPQAALLTVGRIKEQAMVEDGKVIPAAMLTLSLSVDHRVLDGARAARFLGELAELLETPALAME